MSGAPPALNPPHADFLQSLGALNLTIIDIEGNRVTAISLSA
jgi:hypothetical protein